MRLKCKQQCGSFISVPGLFAHVLATPGEWIYVDERLNWLDARNRCQTLKGNLVSIHSARQEAALLTFIQEEATGALQGVWVGGHDIGHEVRS